MQSTTKEGKTRLKYKAGAFEMPPQQLQPEAFYGASYLPGGIGLPGASFGMPFMAPPTDLYASRYGSSDYVEEVVHHIAPKP